MPFLNTNKDYTQTYFMQDKVYLTDIALVKGVFNGNKKIEAALYKHCRTYFANNFRGIFIVNDEISQEEIMQDSFITLWENIERRKIYVEDGVLKGKEGKPFTGALTTYFMGIAKMKHKEYVRKNEVNRSSTKTDVFPLVDTDLFCGEEDDVKHEIVSECISHMSERCNQILTLFYYKEKNLDEIMKILPTYQSKDALKTEKYKCVKSLKKSANAIYNQYNRL